MEKYKYQCPICGYVHNVPAYWMDFSPKEEYELEHPDLRKGEICSQVMLKYVQE